MATWWFEYVLPPGWFSLFPVQRNAQQSKSSAPSPTHHWQISPNLWEHRAPFFPQAKRGWRLKPPEEEKKFKPRRSSAAGCQQSPPCNLPCHSSVGKPKAKRGPFIVESTQNDFLFFHYSASKETEISILYLNTMKLNCESPNSFLPILQPGFWKNFTLYKLHGKSLADGSKLQVLPPSSPARHQTEKWAPTYHTQPDLPHPTILHAPPFPT